MFYHHLVFLLYSSVFALQTKKGDIAKIVRRKWLLAQVNKVMDYFLPFLPSAKPTGHRTVRVVVVIVVLGDYFEVMT